MNELTTTDNPTAIFDDPVVKEAFSAYVDTCCKAVRLIWEMVSSAARIISSWWSAIKDSTVPAKWAHLARYARKKRTRAKYQRMISRRWTELLGAVTAT